MYSNETIIKKNVSGSRTNFKNKLDGDDYSTLLKNKSRRRRSHRHDEHETEVSICPSCGSTEFLFDFNRREKACISCGLVVEENIIDFSIRGTARDKEGNSLSQNGAPNDITIHDGGLSTGFDAREGNSKNKAQWFILNKIQKQSRVWGSHERNLSRAFGQLALIISNLSLSRTVKTESASIYRKAVTNDLVRGRSIEKIMVATVYIACRQCKVPRTLDEIAEVTGVDKKTIGKNYRFLTRELGIKLPLISPNDYVPRFASKLNLPPEVEVKSIEINNLAKERGLTSGKDPASITAASLYAASLMLGERRTQTEIARKLGVTEVTIRNRLKELDDSLNLL